MSPFTLQDIEEIITSALHELYFRDDELLDRVLKEEAINHRLAVYIEHYFNQNQKSIDYVFSVDIEFNKMNGDNKKAILIYGSLKNVRPDIIVHQRSSIMGSNILVIECKKSKFSPYDLQKLEGLMNQGLNYEYGALVNYGIGKKYFHLKIYQGLEEVVNKKIQKEIDV